MKNGASTALARQEKLSDLIKRRTEIRHALVASEKPLQEKLKDIHPSYLKSARKLAHYIALAIATSARAKATPRPKARTAK